MQYLLTQQELDEIKLTAEDMRAKLAEEKKALVERCTRLFFDELSLDLRARAHRVKGFFEFSAGLSAPPHYREVLDVIKGAVETARKKALE